MADEDVIRGVTQRVVDLYTASGLFFTALDVSNQVKQTLPDVRHRFVSPIVRDLFDQGSMGSNYTRTTIEVVTQQRKKAEAFLYHLVGGDIEDGYGEEKRSQLAIPPVSAELEDEELDEGIEEIDLEIGLDGRARLPIALLVRARITDSTVMAEMLGDDLVISAAPKAPSTPSATATILTSSHPTLLHIPATLLTAFDSSSGLVARVVGGQVYITGDFD